MIRNRPHCSRFAELRDGTSHTILIGEKALDAQRADSGAWLCDEPFFLGGSNGTFRLGNGLYRDTGAKYPLFLRNWGAAHPAGTAFLFGDGSVRTLHYQTPSPVVHALMTPNGGESVTLE